MSDATVTAWIVAVAIILAWAALGFSIGALVSIIRRTRRIRTGADTMRILTGIRAAQVPAFCPAEWQHTPSGSTHTCERSARTPHLFHICACGDATPSTAGALDVLQRIRDTTQERP